MQMYQISVGGKVAAVWMKQQIEVMADLIESVLVSSSLYVRHSPAHVIGLAD